MKAERGQIVLKRESVGPEHHYSIIGTKKDLMRLSELLAESLRQMPDPLDKTRTIHSADFEVTAAGGCPDVRLTFLVEPDLKKYGVPKPTPSKLKENVSFAAMLLVFIFAGLCFIAGAEVVLKGIWDILAFWTKWLLQAP